MGISAGTIKASRREHKPTAWPSGGLQVASARERGSINALSSSAPAKDWPGCHSHQPPWPSRLAKRSRAPPHRPWPRSSIVGYDPKTGDLGVAVQSKFFAVGSVVPWAKAGVGAVATQSYANVDYGPEGLEGLAKRQSARETVDALTKADANRRLRQLGIVDAKGRSASFTGSGCKHWAGHIEKPNFCAQGNILTGEEVVRSMVSGYEQARKKTGTGLCDWLALALMDGQKAGGDSTRSTIRRATCRPEKRRLRRGQRPVHRPSRGRPQDADRRTVAAAVHPQKDVPPRPRKPAKRPVNFRSVHLCGTALGHEALDEFVRSDATENDEADDGELHELKCRRG